MSNVSRGRNLEYAVRDRLRARGFVVFRCAGSRPVDLVAVKDGRILLVECKAGLHPSLPPSQLEKLLEISGRVGGSVVLAVRRRYRGIRWFEATAEGLRELKTFPPL